MKRLGPPSVKRLSIDGQVILKRKSKWVKRYAKIENCIFSYATSKNEQFKYSADLRTSKVMLG